MSNELSVEEIVKRINSGDRFKNIADEMGYTQSTLKKRVNKEYYYCAGLKKYIRKDNKNQLEELERIILGNNAAEEIAMLVMERYQDEEYWEDNEYEVWDENFIDENIVMVDFLYNELLRDAEKLSISFSNIVMLYLLRYLAYFKKRNGSGLKFERNYRKSIDKRKDHDSQVIIKDDEYEIRALDRTIKRLREDGLDNEESEFIVKYGAEEEEETYILHKVYLKKCGFNEDEISGIPLDSLWRYYDLAKNHGFNDMKMIELEIKRLDQLEREQIEYEESKSENNESIDDSDDVAIYTAPVFNDILFETEEEKNERHVQKLKENGYTKDQILGLDSKALSKHCMYLYRDECNSFEDVLEAIKRDEFKKQKRVRELERAAEIIVNRNEGDTYWIEEVKENIRANIKREIEEGKERKLYTGTVALRI